MDKNRPEFPQNRTSLVQIPRTYTAKTSMTNLLLTFFLQIVYKITCKIVTDRQEAIRNATICL